MIQPGKYNRLEVVREVDFGVYLADGGEAILLPRKYVPAGSKIGDRLEVFVYYDSEDRIIATTRRPYATVGDIALLEVIAVTPLGAFLDWGLEKDLFVPFREQRKRMESGRKYVVRICYDQVSDRIFASSRFTPLLKPSTADLAVGQQVELIVYDEIDIGFPVLINRCHQGMLYKNQLFRKLKLGEQTSGFITKIADNGNIDVSLQRQGMAGINDARQLILTALQKSGGSLPFTAKSSSEEIREYFNMSRKQFKHALGNLYREQLVEISNMGIELLQNK